MSKLFVAAFAVVAFAGFGCQSDDHGHKHKHNKDDAKMMSVDDCSHCKGSQTAKADGTCPKCGMKVK